MTDIPLTLFCLVDGESTSNAFPVLASTTTTIRELKELIKTKKANRFQDVDADELTLWRVSHPVIAIHKHQPVLLNKIDSPTELDPTDDISDIFTEPPPKKTIHIIVQRPPPSLPYRKAQPLLRTAGLQWVYQPDPELYDILRRTMKDHHNDFFSGLRDKSTIPLYLFLSGAGTGKSRNAQEFHQSALACLNEEDQALRNRIMNAWVFHVSLENGASLLVKEVDPMEAIANRMLLQLLPDKRLRDVVAAYEDVHPMTVLGLVAKGANQDLRSATVILVVDGLQTFMTGPSNGNNKDSAFYKALTNIGDLAFEDVFLMACCTATVTSPVDKALALTHRMRVVLPIASLEPPCISQGGQYIPVFDEEDHIIKVLVSDCGGHGRALESLQRACEKAGKDFNVESLMNGLHLELRNLYSEALLLPPSTAHAMARAILTRTPLYPDKPVPRTTKLPGELAIPGLIRYEQPDGLCSGGYLTAPYIWVWLLSYQPKNGADPLLRNWRFCDYADLKSKTDPRSPPGAQFWQHFEHFVATFRCLKSRVLEEGEHTTISAIHKGARLNGDIQFTNHHLQLAISSNQVDTQSTSYFPFKTIRCEHETLKIRNSEHCIINAASAPFGDSFLGLDAQRFCTEVHQCKLVADGEQIDYEAERSKAASKYDYFMLFTSQERQEIELPSLSGIVDKSNWNSYFGPFAGRAFVFATTGALDINMAPRKDLRRMQGVDEVKADLIIRERSKKRFESHEDAAQRLCRRGIGEKVLGRFKFPRTS
ncbi:hypothetical protein BGW38_002878 [Lunasporangiospora selenospora]|uniref:Crinkler effector protein N-terminal domain-containing protein n=1 Tax=Lunasporangiospora selenospora TaxID=979761 RepID=A0A9P6FSM6_9FUNG|nr:hypothetical protein BGW38_002878 [Lunasporangiospora selenospora]